MKNYQPQLVIAGFLNHQRYVCCHVEIHYDWGPVWQSYLDGRHVILNWTLNDLKQSIPVANGQEILQIFPIWLKPGCHFLGLKQNSCIKYVCVFGFYIQTYPNPKTIWQPVKSFCPTPPESWTISFTKRSAAARPLSDVLDPASTEKISKRSCVSTWPTFAQPGGRCPNLHVFQGSKGSDVLGGCCVGKFAWSFLWQKRKSG